VQLVGLTFKMVFGFRTFGFLGFGFGFGAGAGWQAPLITSTPPSDGIEAPPSDLPQCNYLQGKFRAADVTLFLFTSVSSSVPAVRIVSDREQFIICRYPSRSIKPAGRKLRQSRFSRISLLSFQLIQLGVSCLGEGATKKNYVLEPKPNGRCERPKVEDTPLNDLVSPLRAGRRVE
jgi:hypothetical protein